RGRALLGLGRALLPHHRSRRLCLYPLRQSLPLAHSPFRSGICGRADTHAVAGPQPESRHASRRSRRVGSALIGPNSRSYRPGTNVSEAWTMSAFPKLCLFGGIVFSLGLAADAGAQNATPPDFWVGDAGWVHNLNATFPSVEGSPSPVVQDPAHPFRANTWR